MKRFPSLSDFYSALFVSTSLWLFALFIHNMKGLSALFLFLAALYISFFSKDIKNLLKIIGLSSFIGNPIVFSLVGMLFGLIISFLYKSIHCLPLLPCFLTFSALIAPVIGITEELVFRGFIQGSITGSTAVFRIILSSVSHTVYKFLIIWSLPVHLDINLNYLIIFTFLAGIFSGWLRYRSGSIIPSSLGHGCFDIIVYGDLSKLPIWVWA